MLSLISSVTTSILKILRSVFFFDFICDGICINPRVKQLKQQKNYKAIYLKLKRHALKTDRKRMRTKIIDTNSTCFEKLNLCHFSESQVKKIISRFNILSTDARSKCTWKISQINCITHADQISVDLSYVIYQNNGDNERLKSPCVFHCFVAFLGSVPFCCCFAHLLSFQRA